MPVESPKITWCFIQHPTPENGLYQSNVYVGYTGTEVDNVEADFIFAYYPDELSFKAEEFIGKTRRDAQDMFLTRDMEYLRS